MKQEAWVVSSLLLTNIYHLFFLDPRLMRNEFACINLVVCVMCSLLLLAILNIFVLVYHSQLLTCGQFLLPINAICVHSLNPPPPPRYITFGLSWEVILGF